MTINVKASLDRAIIFLLAAVFIAQQLTHWGPLSFLLGSLVFAAIILLMPQLKGLTLWLTAFFMAGGVLLLLLQKADARYWFEAAGINVTLVTLFVFAPMFGIPVRLPDYVAALKRFYETGVRSRTALFTGTQVLTQILGAFINVGSIPVVYHLTFVKPQPGIMSRLLANAMNRGFGGAIFWSPYFAAMTLVTSALSVYWSSVLPYLLGLSLISVLVSLAVDFRGIRMKEDPPDDEAVHPSDEIPSASRDHARFPIGLGIYLIAAIAIILLLERLVNLPMVLITCMAAVFFPLIWCLAKGAMTTYRQGLANHVKVTLPALQKEITLFLAAGFFSGSIGATGFGAYVPEVLEKIPLPISLSFSIFTIALITLTSLIGLHPIVPVTILATGIDPLAVHISPVYFAILLLGSWGISNPISPASAVNNLLAGMVKKPVFELAGPNYKYAAAMALVLLLYVAAVFS
ncbi:hypothetical protein [Paenibacillus spongiae]|uniref:Citrate transporter-like domain-containing protein n=1 Tax=Paenibacillus spongiae TaxID=2909671 RepID=A0ABY5SBQ0_9BACL|nr:hypothetical protein [Paenibacillus spongiae]UVI30207.1 hypothetical protein L1F29_33395 [Paenibacillus spongiae]